MYSSNTQIYGVIYTEKGRKITLILTIIAEVICCLGLNMLGGFGFIFNGYEKCGYALFISTALLVAALVIAVFKKVIIPILLNILGSVFYIYALAALGSIPNTLIPKENTERLMMNHYPTIIVTILLVLLAFFNFMSEEAVQKRLAAKKAKESERDRALTDNEKIL